MQQQDNISSRHFTLDELARLTGAHLFGDPSYSIEGVEDLHSATPLHASFLENPRYLQQMKNSSAGVIFIHPSVACIEGRHFLITENPSLAFQKVIELFLSHPLSGFEGIHPTAVIHPEATVDSSVSVGPYAVIDRGAIIGAHTVIGAGVSIGAEVVIGEQCFLHPHVVIRERCMLGNRVIIQPGAVIGSCGYGYFTDKKGEHHSLKQLGNVIIEDDVEIGANTTIDRARFKSTCIGKGTKIDNLVQIAHQVCIGPHNLIVSQTGIAGSSKTGRNVVLGGQVGVIGHISLCDGAILAARSAPIKSIDKPGIYGGAPAIPLKEFNEQAVYVRRLPSIVERLEALEKKLAEQNSSED